MHPLPHTPSWRSVSTGTILRHYTHKTRNEIEHFLNTDQLSNVLKMTYLYRSIPTAGLDKDTGCLKNKEDNESNLAVDP
jgi:hypothetical protein